jgi:hypothetical protein
MPVQKPKRSTRKRPMNEFFKTMLAAKNAVGGPREFFMYKGAKYVHKRKGSIDVYKKSK